MSLGSYSYTNFFPYINSDITGSTGSTGITGPTGPAPSGDVNWTSLTLITKQTNYVGAVISVYNETSFTGTIYSNSNSNNSSPVSIRFNALGNIVAMETNTAYVSLTGTSTQLNIDNLPSAVIPSTGTNFPCVIMSGGTTQNQLGIVYMPGANSRSMYINADPTVTNTFAVGTSGINPGFGMTYRLT